MADAKKCDRCGAFYIPEFNGPNGRPISHSLVVSKPFEPDTGRTIRTTIELCAKCFCKFDDWFYEGRNHPNE